jgi:hypothetical protein
LDVLWLIISGAVSLLLSSGVGPPRCSGQTQVQSTVWCVDSTYMLHQCVSY